jgi:hypothetical protein
MDIYISIIIGHLSFGENMIKDFWAEEDFEFEEEDARDNTDNY